MMNVDESLDRALALLISSTRRRSRNVSLIDIGEALDVALNRLGSLTAVGDRIGLTGKMLGQFSKVNELSKKVTKLVQERKIDSVDMVSHLARLNNADQDEVARRVLDDNWTTADVRSFVELRKYDAISLSQQLADRVSLSKTQREFALDFVPRGLLNADSVKSSLGRWIPIDSIVTVNVTGSKGTIVLSESGFAALRQEAKSRNVPVKQILPLLLYRL